MIHGTDTEYSSILLPQLLYGFGACHRAGPVFPPLLPHQFGLQCVFLVCHVRPPQELRIGGYGDTPEFATWYFEVRVLTIIRALYT